MKFEKTIENGRIYAVTAQELIATHNRSELLSLIGQYVAVFETKDPFMCQTDPPFGVRDWLEVKRAQDVGKLEGEFLVLSVSGTVEGLLNYRVEPHQVIELHLVIGESQRGKGYGTIMYEALIDFGQERGVDCVLYNLVERAKPPLIKACERKGIHYSEQQEGPHKKFVVDTKR